MGSTSVTPSEKAAHNGRWAETMFRALVQRVSDRWEFVSFRGKGGGEWCGVVDILAIRKNSEPPTDAELKRGDVFDIVLVQLKGGGSKVPSRDDLNRLKRVADRYNARAIVLYEWKNAVHSRFKHLDENSEWVEKSAAELFGKRRKNRLVGSRHA